MCTNNNYNNNAVINNNYRRLQDHILLLKISMGMWKIFSEIYRKFRHAPSKSFASPDLVYTSITENAIFMKPKNA